jgi:predicted outer membrane protein
MKCTSICLAAALCAQLAHAASDADERVANAFRDAPVARSAPAMAPAAPAVAAKPGMFAAASASMVRRLTPEQRDEWRFLKDAAAASRFENDASRMALAKSNDPAVRAFAATLINYHGSAFPVLQQMLYARNMAPPMLANDQRKVLNRMAKLQGAKFDREYLAEVALRSQQDDVSAFERAASTARDPALRSWVERTLPTLRYQLATAEQATGTGPAVVKAAPPQAEPPPHMATRAMGAAPAKENFADLGEGNMLLGPAHPVAVKLNEAARTR